MTEPVNQQDTSKDATDIVDTASKETQAETNNGENAKSVSQKPEDTVGFWQERYKQEQRKITEQGQELARLKKERELESKQDKITAVLEKLAENKKEPEANRDFDSFINELSEDYSTDPKVAIRKQMAALNTWMQQDKDATKAEIKAYKEELAKLRDEVFSTVERSDPLYEKNKVFIDELVENGMSLSKAKQFVKEKLVKFASEITQRDTPPPMVNASRTAPEKTISGYFSSEEEKAKFKVQNGFTDEEVKYLEDEYARNLIEQKRIESQKAGV